MKDYNFIEAIEQGDTIFNKVTTLPVYNNRHVYDLALKSFYRDSIKSSLDTLNSNPKVYLYFILENERGKKISFPKSKSEITFLKNSVLSEVAKMIDDSIQSVKWKNEYKNMSIDEKQRLKNSVKERKDLKFDRKVNEALFKTNLSSWDGSLPDLVEYTKKNLHNPSSFEHVQTGFVILDDYVKVKMIYRAENGFGALRKEAIIAAVNSKGEVIKILQTIN